MQAGDTPLHGAASVEVAKYLLNRKANVHAANKVSVKILYDCDELMRNSCSHKDRTDSSPSHIVKGRKDRRASSPTWGERRCY